MKGMYTKEFEVKACKLVTEEGLKLSVAAEKPGINAVMLYRWVDEYRTHGEKAFVGNGHLTPAGAELRKLRKKNERLKTENEILRHHRTIWLLAIICLYGISLQSSI